MPGGECGHAADTGNHLVLEPDRAPLVDLLDDGQGAVVQARIPPHQEGTRLPLVELVTDEPLADVGAARAPVLDRGGVGGVVRSRSGSPASTIRYGGRACASTRSCRNWTRSCLASPLSRTKNTSVRAMALTAWRVRWSGSPAPMPMMRIRFTCQSLPVPLRDSPQGAAPADVHPIHPHGRRVHVLSRNGASATGELRMNTFDAGHASGNNPA